MEIATNTKISAILKANPASIEAIASINRHFEKLRNPLLRKILASRVTFADAARIGGCTEEEFYKRLEPLGFTRKLTQINAAQKQSTAAEKPVYLRQMAPQSILTLDVCEDIATGNDPFLNIMAAVEQVNNTNALLLINTFEPTPLISILQKKGYTSFVEVLSPELVHTYLWLENASIKPLADTKLATNDFDVMVNDYEGRLRYLDVRHLEMPQPMIAILGELETLPAGEALHVTHRKVPQFLLPKLQERGCGIAIKEIGPHEVDLLIYKEN
ncbi:uncharacterized protein (DUF2249 family) [Pontibacter aydingkolensis]|uniref:DUF2249 domain-containing protein n=1 Tax=Pontibacter aydingkolensis TaxID=1911536 RepID=A0ABS7CSV8_9BACT|nr:DUF2249 domain-containing protein [Pontibacter aydingkolensis]MBW7466926.1 DUF2249 domain-containing protein [Pontibacter aydingkolensis]